MSVTLQIDGVGRVEVGDDFKSMGPAEQDAFVSQIVAQSAKGVKSSLGGPASPDDAPARTVPANTQAPAFDLSMGEATLQFGNVDPNAGPSQMPYSQQMQNAASTLAQGAGGVAKAMANGMTFGFADKGVAALRAATGDAPDYPTAINQERAATDAVGSQVPGLNTAIKTGGAALTGAGMLRSGLSLGARAVETGAPLVAKALGFGADAAGAGATQAVGNLDSVPGIGPDGTPASYPPSFSDYANAARQGAQTGAILGAGLPAAGAALGGAYRSAAPFFARPGRRNGAGCDRIVE